MTLTCFISKSHLLSPLSPFPQKRCVSKALQPKERFVMRCRVWSLHLHKELGERRSQHKMLTLQEETQAQLCRGWCGACTCPGQAHRWDAAWAPAPAVHVGSQSLGLGGQSMGCGNFHGPLYWVHQVWNPAPLFVFKYKCFYFFSPCWHLFWSSPSWKSIYSSFAIEV